MGITAFLELCGAEYWRRNTTMLTAMLILDQPLITACNWPASLSAALLRITRPTYSPDHSKVIAPVCHFSGTSSSLHNLSMSFDQKPKLLFQTALPHAGHFQAFPACPLNCPGFWQAWWPNIRQTYQSTNQCLMPLQWHCMSWIAVVYLQVMP